MLNILPDAPRKKGNDPWPEALRDALLKRKWGSEYFDYFEKHRKSMTRHADVFTLPVGRYVNEHLVIVGWAFCAAFKQPTKTKAYGPVGEHTAQVGMVVVAYADGTGKHLDWYHVFDKFDEGHYKWSAAKALEYLPGFCPSCRNMECLDNTGCFDHKGGGTETHFRCSYCGFRSVRVNEGGPRRKVKK